MMAIDDFLDRGRDARRRLEEAADELAALVKALDGLAGVGMLDKTQQNELAKLKARPRKPRRTATRSGARATSRAGATRRT